MDKNIENKLTDAAKDGLNQTVQEIADLILEKAIQKARVSNTFDKEISLREIIEAKNEILSQNEILVRKQNKRRRIVQLLAITGCIYTMFGMMFYIIQNYNYDITKDFGLIISLIGISITIISLFYFIVSANKIQHSFDEIQKMKKNILEYEIINKWRIIELLGTKLMIKHGISNSKAKSINFIVDFISNELSDTISRDKFKKLLIARNEIVHKGISYSKSEINEIQDIANDIIKELESKIKE